MRKFLKRLLSAGKVLILHLKRIITVKLGGDVSIGDVIIQFC